MSRGSTARYKRRAAVPEPDEPTTLSSAARGVDITAARSWTRRHLLFGAIGVVVGSTSGAALALRSVEAGTQPVSTTSVAPTSVAPTSTSSSSSAPASAPLSPPPVSADASPAIPAATPPVRDLDAALVAQIKSVLVRFRAWADEHPDGRCPGPADLGVSALDPWGRGLRIVCKDQPADQIAGVLSYGPDGAPGTLDDVVSWALGPEVTGLVRGPRWGSTQRTSGRGRPRTRSAPASAASAGSPVTRASAPGPSLPAGTGTPSSSPPPPAVTSAAPSQPAAPPATRSSVGSGTGSSAPDGEGIPDRR
jgi:hypothetical protein